ncbi:nitrogenase component 1 [Paraclostridium bifermentans]|uniref:nitrogenase component 1 n=1 Tax=Paraclostridium bifermentans TaxID=1490 RepID=UPI001FF610C3|nr:nitrogenase component 1 [Paraclostridium bifermentans]UOW68783.1 nitrogenase component 1 [Paraclostridium bifermentans]
MDEEFKYLKIPDDKIGMIWTLSCISDICVIEFGTHIKTHHVVENINKICKEDRCKIYSIHTDENENVCSIFKKLKNTIINLDNDIKPKYIFIVESSQPSIIGEKILDLCKDLKEISNCKLLPINMNNLNYDYNIGREFALEFLAKKIVKQNEKDMNKYNIIGFSIDKYNYLADIKELQRMMKELFNKEVNTMFTINASIEEIENASKASLNIVARKDALKAAKYMEEEYGIPYIYINLYGFKNAIKFIESIKKIDGYELDEEKYTYEMDQVKKRLLQVKKKFYFYKGSKDCAIFGDFDTVLGISEMLKELGFNVDKKEIIYKTCDDANIVNEQAYLETTKYLNDKELLILLGDRVSIDMRHKSKKDLQISNTSLDSADKCIDTPYIGFKGCMYIINQILNIDINSEIEA